jgi:hypothetical protein
MLQLAMHALSSRKLLANPEINTWIGLLSSARLIALMPHFSRTEGEIDGFSL